MRRAIAHGCNKREFDMRKLMMGVATASLLAASVVQAAPSASTRAATPVGQAEEMGASGAHIWLGLLGAVLVGLVIWQINDDGDETLPTSP
jgi:hypothetical protein